MTYASKAQEHLRAAQQNGEGTGFPWTIVIPLATAIVYALLAIAVALEELSTKD